LPGPGVASGTALAWFAEWMRTGFAEETGFEPVEDLHPRRFSKPLPSTTRPLLRELNPCGFARLEHRRQPTICDSADPGLASVEEASSNLILAEAQRLETLHVHLGAKGDAGFPANDA
jgi:hypothetical protein